MEQNVLNAYQEQEHGQVEQSFRQDYWEQTERLAEAANGAIAVGSIPEGWLWAIPLSDGTMSVGAVIHKDAFKEQRKDLTVAAIYERIGVIRIHVPDDSGIAEQDVGIVSHGCLLIFTADEPERPRGKQDMKLWCDEVSGRVGL